MSRETILNATLGFIAFLFFASAIGYLFFPSKMLGVVGIIGTAQTKFLVQTLAAAFVALTPIAWAARSKKNDAIYETTLNSFAIYMFLSSVVDFYAYISNVVNFAAIPSIVFRIVLGGIVLWFKTKK